MEDEGVIIDVTPEEPDATTGQSSGPKRRRAFIIVGAAAAIGVFVGGIFSAPWIDRELKVLWGETESLSESDAALIWAQIDHLREQVEDGAIASRITQALARIDTRLGVLETTDSGTGYDELSNRLTAVEDDIAEIGTILTTLGDANAAQDSGAVDGEWDRRLTELERQIVALAQGLKSAEPANSQAEDIRQSLAILALVRLRQAVENGEAFGPALAGVERLLADDAAQNDTLAGALNAARSEAATGIETIAALTSQFTALAGDIITADQLDTDAAWYERMLSSLRNSIKIRRTDDYSGNTIEAKIALVEYQLAQSNLAGAVVLALNWGERTNAVIANWLGLAQARLDILAALDVMEQYVNQVSNNQQVTDED